MWRRERGSEPRGVLRPKLLSQQRAVGPGGLDDQEGDRVAHWVGGSELELLGPS